MAYATLAQLREYLGIAVANTGDDALLTRLLTVAQAQVDAYTGRTFEAAGDTTRYFDAALDVCGRTLLLRHDLAQITSVTNGDGAVVASTQYTTDPRNVAPYHALHLRRTSPVFWWWLTDPADAIAVVGRWAYSVTAPLDIVQATLRLAAYSYRQRDAQVFDVTSDPNTGQLYIPKGLPSDVKIMLQPYIRRSL